MGVVVTASAEELSQASFLRQSWLQPHEIAALSALKRSADKQNYLAAHALVRVCVAMTTNLRFDEIRINQFCGICGRAHGKPSVEGFDLNISLSHSHGRVAAAVSYLPVAVDIEKIVPSAPCAGMIDAVLTSEEKATLVSSPNVKLSFTRLWAVKESLIKLGLASLDTLPTVSSLNLQMHRLDWGGTKAGFVGCCLSSEPMNLIEEQAFVWGKLIEIHGFEQ